MAIGVLEHYRQQQKRFPEQSPMGPNNSASLVAYFKYLWRDYVEEGCVDLASVSNKEHVGAGDVIDRLPNILERLTQGEFLEKIGDGYMAVTLEEN